MQLDIQMKFVSILYDPTIFYIKIYVTFEIAKISFKNKQPHIPQEIFHISICIRINYS